MDRWLANTPLELEQKASLCYLLTSCSSEFVEIFHQCGGEIGRKRGSADGQGPAASEKERERRGARAVGRLGHSLGRCGAGEELGLGLVPGKWFLFFLYIFFLFSKAFLNRILRATKIQPKEINTTIRYASACMHKQVSNSMLNFKFQ